MTFQNLFYWCWLLTCWRRWRRWRCVDAAPAAVVTQTSIIWCRGIPVFRNRTAVRTGTPKYRVIPRIPSSSAVVCCVHQEDAVCDMSIFELARRLSDQTFSCSTPSRSAASNTSWRYANAVFLSWTVLSETTAKDVRWLAPFQMQAVNIDSCFWFQWALWTSSWNTQV